MRKLFYSFLLITIIVWINVLQFINYNSNVTSDMEVDDKRIIKKIDNTIYDKLSIKSLYIKSPKSDDNSKILWYLKDGIYYLFLPKLVDCNNMVIEFDAGVDTYLSIYDGESLVTKIVSNESVKLEKEDYIFKLETNVKETTAYKVRIMKSEAPALFINIDGGDASFKAIKADRNHNKYYPGIASIADDDNNIQSAIFKKFKGRGNATWRREKKPFSLKFEEKVSVLGMKEAKNWVLLANHYDGTMARNYLWLNFARDLKLEYTSECKPVELYVNNKYQGTYLVTNKIEAKDNRVEIADNDYLFEFDHHVGAGDFKLTHGYQVIVHNPEIDKLTKEEKSKVLSNAKKYLNKIESLVYNQKIDFDELSKYLDLESFAKYYWVNELSLSYDGFRGSFYVYTKNGKLHAGPIWDLDSTMNRSFVYTSLTGYYVLDDGKLNSRRLTENWSRQLMKRREFSDLVDNIYFEYKDIFDNLPNNLDRYLEETKLSANMNYTRWPYKGMIKDQWDKKWRKDNYDYESACNLFKKDLNRRVTWYDSQYDNLYYNKITYSLVDVDGKEFFTDESLLDKSIFIPTKTKLIKIYGTNDMGKEILLKEVEVLDKFVDASFTLKNKTSSKYKKYNRFNYKISFLVI